MASVTAGQTATFALAVAPSNGFKAPVSFTCKGLPAGASCNFSPASMTMSARANVGLSISTTGTTHAQLRKSRLMFAFWLPLFGVALIGSRKRKILLLGLVLLLAVGMLEIGCGGGGHAMNAPSNNTTTQASQSATPVGTYTVTVVATSGSMQHTAGVQLVVK